MVAHVDMVARDSIIPDAILDMIIPDTPPKIKNSFKKCPSETNL